MRFTSDRGSRRESDGINVTSLVDIIFNLLLFFMLTTSFSESAGLEVRLPTADASDITPTSDDLVVVITRGGDIVVRDQIVATDELEGVLKAHREAAPTGTVLLEADHQVPHGTVVEVVDAAKRVGVRAVGIATQR
jgi:biopolymer transport protein ExbD